MIAVGTQVPDGDVWLDPDTKVTLQELAQDGPFLLFFYLFDWTST